MDTLSHHEQDIIVPNGYGTLQYAKDLLIILQASGRDVKLLELPGQQHTHGTLNIASGSEELLNIINNDSTKKNLVLHCSSLLLLETISDKLSDQLNKVIVYSYLANPQKHHSSFLEKSRGYGLNIDVSQKDVMKYGDPTIVNRL